MNSPDNYFMMLKSLLITLMTAYLREYLDLPPALFPEYFFRIFYKYKI